MILRALKDLADREGLVADPDFEIRGISWLVRVGIAGTILSITDHRVTDEAIPGKKPPKPRPRNEQIPRQAASRSGTKAPPAFLVDNAKYVFGLSTPDKPFEEAEGREKSGWFRDEIANCVKATGDAGAQAVLTAIDAVRSGVIEVTLSPDCVSNHLFAFVYAPDVDVPVHRRPAVVAYWRSIRVQEQQPADAQFTCVVTGVPVAQPGTFPKVKGIPGGQSSGASFISFNAAAFESYGWDTNENAALSRGAAEACGTALERLVHRAYPNPDPARSGETLPRRNVTIGDSTLVTYWSSAISAETTLDMFGLVLDTSGNPESVNALYSAPWRGRLSSINDPSQFYALTISGAQGRIVVRDWFETGVTDVARNLVQYFDDLTVVRNTPTPRERVLPTIPALNVLLSSLAPFGDRAQVPEALGTALIRAALRGTLFPLSLLSRAVERTRAEIGKTEWADWDRRDARASLIKAVMNRRRRLAPLHANYPDLTPTVDPSNENPGYLLGRLMAVLEQLQQVAIGNPNASVVDRYFGAASATPRTVFVRLLKNARHHAQKARDNEQSAGLARWLERLIDDIASRFDPRRNGFPATLSLEDQGLFVLGYHQQRHWLHLPKEAREAAGVSST